MADQSQDKIIAANPVDSSTELPMASVVSAAAPPMALAVTAPSDASEESIHGGTVYVAASAGDFASYFLRSDGAVDRTLGKGVISSRIFPPQDATYIQVSYGRSNSYLLRSDGSIDRIKSKGIVSSTMNPPPGKKYIKIKAGYGNSYFLRDDGAVDRTAGGGKLSSSFKPPEKAKYIDLAIGTEFSYFIRDDGCIDRTRGKGNLNLTIHPPEGTKYIAACGAQDFSYFLRADGAIDRTVELTAPWKTKGAGKVSSTYQPPAGVKYIAVSEMFAVTPNGKGDTSPWAVYFVRDDGAVDRVKEQACPIIGEDTEKVSATLNPPPGLRYVQVTSGIHNSYLVQSDGKIARTSGKGVVEKELLSAVAGVEISEAKGKEGSAGGCVVM